MARNRIYRGNRSAYYARRGISYARSGYRGARRAYSKTGMNLSMEFLAGLAGAFVVPANPDIDMVGVAVACAPIKGLGKVKGVAQGFVFGQAMQHYVLPKVGINIPDIMNATNLLGGSNTSGSNTI